jgi:hopanoid biosynthesis associated radical SAM protein HpnH
MRFPVSLYTSMARYLLEKKLRREEKFPLVLMLEPTHRCNLSCAGCGRIREYHQTLQKEMSLEDCLESVNEAGTPVVTVTGGEPLLYSNIQELVQELLRKKKHIYFCTNGLLMEDFLERFRPHPRFTWNVHFDGTQAVHDEIIGKRGGFQRALKAVAAARSAGYRVSTNTTVYRETKVGDLERLFSQLTAAGVDGILVALGFSYEMVAGDVFLTRREIMDKFRVIRTWKNRFPIISNPIYLDFCAGKRSFQCTPWGNPTRNSEGWKSPCYLITDTHYQTFSEMMTRTNWDHYQSGRDPRCAQCMVHCGFEPTIVSTMNGRDLLGMLKWNLYL